MTPCASRRGKRGVPEHSATTTRQKKEEKDSKIGSKRTAKREGKRKTNDNRRDKRENERNKRENTKREKIEERKRACCGGCPRPHGLLQVGGVDSLPPHAHLPPQKQLLLLGVLHPLQHVVRVEDLPGGRQMIQVPRVEVAHEHAVAPGGRKGRRSLVDPAGRGRPIVLAECSCPTFLIFARGSA
jgi:hypothetical protein